MLWLTVGETDGKAARRKLPERPAAKLPDMLPDMLLGKLPTCYLPNRLPRANAPPVPPRQTADRRRWVLTVRNSSLCNRLFRPQVLWRPRSLLITQRKAAHSTRINA